MYPRWSDLEGHSDEGRLPPSESDSQLTPSRRALNSELEVSKARYQQPLYETPDGKPCAMTYNLLDDKAEDGNSDGKDRNAKARIG